MLISFSLVAKANLLRIVVYRPNTELSQITAGLVVAYEQGAVDGNSFRVSKHNFAFNNTRDCGPGDDSVSSRRESDCFGGVKANNKQAIMSGAMVPWSQQNLHHSSQQ
jgi:hypothetical protein